MSDWKNPSQWGDDNRRAWNPPAVDDDNVENIAMGIALGLRAVIGFIVISSVNALALMSVVMLLGGDISYRNALAIGAIYLCWRAYDTVIYSRFTSKK